MSKRITSIALFDRNSLHRLNKNNIMSNFISFKVCFKQIGLFEIYPAKQIEII